MWGVLSSFICKMYDVREVMTRIMTIGSRIYYIRGIQRK